MRPIPSPPGDEAGGGLSWLELTTGTILAGKLGQSGPVGLLPPFMFGPTLLSYMYGKLAGRGSGLETEPHVDDDCVYSLTGCR